MTLTGFYPVLLVSAVEPVAAFYQAHFGFVRVFDSSWYVHLRSSNGTIELAIMTCDHDTIPIEGRRQTQGLLLSFEVEDAATEYTRLLAANVPMLQVLREEPFGQRHFIASDPAGTMLDIITPIEPDAAWLAAHS